MMIEQTLQAYLQQPSGSLRISFDSGDEFHGETHFQLDGTGNYHLSSTLTQGRQQREYSGQVDQDQVKSLVRALLDAKLWEAKHVEPNMADSDSQAVIRVQTDTANDEVLLWTSEIKQVPQFSASRKAIVALIDRVSNEEVLERMYS